MSRIQFSSFRAAVVVTKVEIVVAIREGDMNGSQLHEHHWHAFEGPTMIVLKDGHILQKCCQREATRQIHQDHALSEWQGNRARTDR